MPVPTYDYLDSIIRHKQKEVSLLREKAGSDYVQRALDSIGTNPPRRLSAALRKPGVRVIAEIKRMSPSKGTLRAEPNLPQIAKDYEAGGASAISVLTDTKFFGGRPHDLTQVRMQTGLPVLRKDFIIDRIQVYESRILGADAILLIASCLREDELKELYETAHHLGMDCLVEVHDDRDIARAAGLDPEIVGVNNRDLRTFETRIQTSLRLFSCLPANALKVSESGISSPEDIDLLGNCGYDGALVGEALMRSDHPKELLAHLSRLQMCRGDTPKTTSKAEVMDQAKTPTAASNVKAKICGITTAQDAVKAALAGADALGFIFSPRSPRSVNPNLVREIVLQLYEVLDCFSSSGRAPALVGVFVDQDVDFVLETVRKARLNAVQLHGSETPAMAQEISGYLCSLDADKSKARWPQTVKTIHITGPDSLERFSDYAEAVDAVLLDSKVGTAYGGTGLCFDWSIANQCMTRYPSLPLIMAGGLTPQNLRQAIRICAPFGVDVSSGVEISPGQKDPGLLKQFVATAHAGPSPTIQRMVIKSDRQKTSG